MKSNWACYWIEMDDWTHVLNVHGGCVMERYSGNINQDIRIALVYLPAICVDFEDDGIPTLRPIGEAALPTWVKKGPPESYKKWVKNRAKARLNGMFSGG